jgi:CheY-like chemotaxis protein
LVTPKTYHALIVEDTADMARIMELTLRTLGVDSFRAMDGPQALDFLAENTPDVILLDIGLPGMSGWEVLEQIKTRYPEANYPVIVLTAFNDPANRLIGKLQHRVFRYLTKPFDVSVLAQTIRDALGITPSEAS